MLTQKHSFDVIVVGGSYAGLSASLALGRSRRNVLIIDSGNPCNAQTPHSHNFLTQDGKTPLQIARLGKEQVLMYPTVSYDQDLVVSVHKEFDQFHVHTESGKSFSSRKLLLATGIKDAMPDLEGFKACWGISVLHCPYCHGYEVRDTTIGVLSSGNEAIEWIKVLQNWSKDLILFTDGGPAFSNEQTEFLSKLSISIVKSPLKSLIHEGGYLNGVELMDGTFISLKAIFARVPFTHVTDIANQLGCAFADNNLIKVDELGKTNVEGVYAAGDNSQLYRSVSLAVSSGTKSGVGINKELIEADINKLISAYSLNVA